MDQFAILLGQRIDRKTWQSDVIRTLVIFQLVIGMLKTGAFPA